MLFLWTETFTQVWIYSQPRVLYKIPTSLKNVSPLPKIISIIFMAKRMVEYDKRDNLDWQMSSQDGESFAPFQRERGKKNEAWRQGLTPLFRHCNVQCAMDIHADVSWM